MASLSDIRTRIGSVKNTQQVTRAMKMVAAAKLRRAQERIFATRPYAFKIRDVISHLQGEVDATGHPLFTERPVERALVIVVTADRGLAGAFNTNAIKTAEETIRERYADVQRAGGLKILAVGRKGHEHFSRRKYNLVGDYRGTFDSLDVKTAQDVVNVAVQGFEVGEWDEVVMVYNEFKNTISQNRVAEPLLPIPHEQFATPVMEDAYKGVPTSEAEATEYIFEPGPAAILDALVPRYLNYQVWRALLESNASEQGARMIAMDNATNNADDLLKELKLTYNRARQSAITTEIIEIVSGANALENA